MRINVIEIRPTVALLFSLASHIKPHPLNESSSDKCKDSLQIKGNRLMSACAVPTSALVRAISIPSMIVLNLIGFIRCVIAVLVQTVS